MYKVKTIIKRIIGCLEIALVCALFFGGMIAFAVRMMFGVNICINVFAVIFSMVFSMLLVCV